MEIQKVDTEECLELDGQDQSFGTHPNEIIEIATSSLPPSDICSFSLTSYRNSMLTKRQRKKIPEIDSVSGKCYVVHTMMYVI